MKKSVKIPKALVVEYTPPLREVETRAKGRCEWRSGHSPHWVQCIEPAVLGRGDGTNNPEGAVWCREHRAKVYVTMPRRA